MEGKDDIQLPKGQLDAILHAIAKSEENTGNKLNCVKNEMMESFGGKLEEVKLVAEDAKSTALKAVDQAELNRLEIERINGQLLEWQSSTDDWRDDLVSNLIEQRAADTQAHMDAEMFRVNRELVERENNLVLSDISEANGAKQDMTMVRELLKVTFDMGGAMGISIKRCYRRGESSEDRPRALVVVLGNDEDMWKVIKAANRAGCGRRVKRDFPPPVIEARTTLEKIKYTMTKGGAENLRIRYPAALWHGDVLVRDYFPEFRRVKCSTLDEARKADRFEDLSEELKAARTRGAEVLKHEPQSRGNSPTGTGGGGQRGRGNSRGSHGGRGNRGNRGNRGATGPPGGASKRKRPDNEDTSPRRAPSPNTQVQTDPQHTPALASNQAAHPEAIQTDEAETSVVDPQPATPVGAPNVITDDTNSEEVLMEERTVTPTPPQPATAGVAHYPSDDVEELITASQSRIHLARNVKPAGSLKEQVMSRASIGRPGPPGTDCGDNARPGTSTKSSNKSDESRPKAAKSAHNKRRQAANHENSQSRRRPPNLAGLLSIGRRPRPANQPGDVSKGEQTLSSPTDDTTRLQIADTPEGGVNQRI